MQNETNSKAPMRVRSQSRALSPLAQRGFIKVGGFHSPLSARPWSTRCRASGHNRLSLLCSACESGHWLYGDTCEPCHAGFEWLVPLVFVVGACALLCVLWFVAGLEASGRRTLQTTLFWFQLTTLLERSAQVHGRGHTGTAWLAVIRGALGSWSVFRPWAWSCVSGEFDELNEAMIVLAAPFVSAGLCGLALSFVPAAYRRRLRVASSTLLLAIFLPATTVAFSAFNCESQQGVSYLSASPSVSCSSPWTGRMLLYRLMGLATLLFYSLPAVVLSWRAWSRHFPSASSSVLDMPLLDTRDEYVEDEEDDSAVSQQMTSASYVLFLSMLRDTETDGGTSSPLRYFAFLATTGRGLALAALVGLVPVTFYVLPVGVFLVLLASLMAHAHYRPWKHGLDNALEAAVLAVASALYLLTIVSGSTSSATDLRESGGNDSSAAIFSATAHVGMLSLLGYSCFVSYIRPRLFKQ